MEAAAETHNDLVNLLNEKNIAITEIKAEAAQSAEAVNTIIEENCQLKADNERLQAEVRELRIKLWDATEEERKMDAGRLRDVLKVL
jgi:regulator of replication initiation timing